MQKAKFSIGTHPIKEYGKVFIIAEAGVNHNQDLKLALKLVDIASDSGADAIKFQTFNAEDVVTGYGKMADYQRKNLGYEKSQFEMLKALEMPESFYKPLIKRCKEKKILFMSTPHGGKKSVDLLEKFGVKAYKIGSGDLTNYILLDKVALTNKPVILSSGMATLEEAALAINFIKSRNNYKIAILHCTTNYPCPPDQINLLAMKTMMEKLDVPVGYSDHTTGFLVGVMAAALGTAVYECHFTPDKSLPGPDHIASANPEELKEKIKLIRQCRKILGKTAKSPTKIETALMKKTVRKSLVAALNLRKGHIIKDGDIEAKRPGDGLSPTLYENVIGKRLNRNILKDEQILIEDFEDV